jgi:hypothetical protein
MDDWCVYIKSYDDLDMLEGAVKSIPDGVPIYVLDGRYADFDGDGIRTDGAEDWCESEDNVHYHTPPDVELPWGHRHVDVTPSLRAPIHEQAKWANYRMLPQDRWVIHMDADERLETFAVDWDDLDSQNKYVPYIDSLAERDVGVPRLYVPEQWTFWIAGVMYPRAMFPRWTPLPRLLRLHVETRYQYSHREALTESIRITNVGDSRPPDYHERRADQLDNMGRHDRAEQYREMIDDG